MLTSLQSKILSALNTVLTEEGFAVGGGVGLQAHGVVNRDVKESSHVILPPSRTIASKSDCVRY